MTNFKWKSLFIVLLAVVVLTGCLPKKDQSGKEETSTQKQTTQKESVKEESKEGLSGTIKELIGLGKSLKCTWNKDENFNSVGYIKGNKYYGEIERLDGENNKTTGFIIIKDECMWSWEKNKAEGIKMCFDTSEMEGTDDLSKSIWDMDSSVTGTEYKCVPAIVSDSKFDPPSDVNFMDMEEMMKGMGQ
jgi:hypothetical protein